MKQIGSKRGHEKSGVGFADIKTALRDDILTGRLQPGQRLPVLTNLASRFNTNHVTLLRAVHALVNDGYLRTEKRVGIYVAKNPPHLSQYAMIFPFKAEDLTSQFLIGLRNEAAKRQSAEMRVSLFYNIEEHVDVEDYQQLVSFVKAHRVAGLIFTEPLFKLQGTPLIDEPGIPRVVNAYGPFLSGIPAVGVDIHGFMPRALRYLRQQGRRKAAAIIINDLRDPVALTEHYAREAAAAGLELLPHNVVSISALTPRWARIAIQTLFRRPDHERPDALIITDDNLVPDATAGLLEMGLRAPQDLEIVAHTNFPWPTPSHVPVTRLGYDLSQMLDLFIERIDQQRRGETAPPRTLLPPIFESEMSPKRTSETTVRQEGFATVGEPRLAHRRIP